MSDTSTPKRTDVGFGRPPVEHQFKPGNKPRPRKAKKAQEETTAELLWKILQEDVRIASGRRPIWMRKAEALYRKAHELADRGNPTMRRLITEIMMRNEKAGAQTDELADLPMDGSWHSSFL